MSTRTGHVTIEQMLSERWRVQANNLIGGWCITLESEERTPADGGEEFADFMSEAVAHHIVAVHNESLVS